MNILTQYWGGTHLLDQLLPPSKFTLYSATASTGTEPMVHPVPLAKFKNIRELVAPFGSLPPC